MCDFGNPFNKNLKKLQEWQEVSKEVINRSKRRFDNSNTEDLLRDLRRKRTLKRDPLKSPFKEYDYKTVPEIDGYTDIRKVNDSAIRSGYVGFPDTANSFMEMPIPATEIKLYKSRISGKYSIPKKYKKYEDYIK